MAQNVTDILYIVDIHTIQMWADDTYITISVPAAPKKLHLGLRLILPRRFGKYVFQSTISNSIIVDSMQQQNSKFIRRSVLKQWTRVQKLCKNGPLMLGL